MVAENQSVRDRLEAIHIRRLVTALLFGLLPAFGLYFLGSLFAGGPVVVLLPIGIVLCGAVLYQAVAIRTQVGLSLKLLSGELFLLPIGGLAFLASGSDMAFGGLGFFIGGFVIGYPIAFALYVFGDVIDRE